MKVLVFGATGFIGTDLVKKLLELGFEVTGTSRHEASPILISNKKYTHVIMDIAKQEEFAKLRKRYDYVFNMAVYIASGYSINPALPCLLTNAIGTLNILEFMVKHKIFRLIYSSSISVYGKPKKITVKENSLLNPITVYGISKLTAEKYCQMYGDLYGLKISILRYGSVYGSGLNKKTVFPLFIDKTLKNEDITLYGEGTRSQDFVYVDDVVNANILAMKKNKTGVFNIGSGIKTTMKELAEVIIEVLGSKSKIKYDLDKPQEFSIGINIDKAKRELGYKPKYNLRTGLHKYKESLL